MTKTRTIQSEIITALQGAQTVLICTHVNPDGDTIGSALALRLGLQRLGKEVAVCCQDKVPDVLHMLPGWAAILHPNALADKRFDLFVPVDVSDAQRLGQCEKLRDRCTHSVQIDHHDTNPAYCEWNEIDGTASATALMIRAVLRQLNVELDQEIAMCLYAGIATDTGNFSYSNTTAEAFAVAGELMANNLPLATMNRTLFRVKQPCQVTLLCRALNSYRFHHHGEITSMMLTQEDFAACGALPEHADTIVNFGMEVEGVKMALLARETDGGRVKMSLRALKPWSVAGVAARFGGGGHAQAAGCTMDDAIAVAVEKLVAAMEEELAKETQ